MADARKDGFQRPRTLSAAFVRTVTRPGRYGDGRGGFGLALLVRQMTNGRLSRVWIQRVRIADRPTNLGLGRFPLVNLSEARAAALANARAIEQGRDPRAARVPTFAAAVERVIALHEPTWKDGSKSANDWRASLRRYAIPLMGRLPVSDVTTAHVLAVLVPIWNEKRTTARLVRQRIGAVMQWAVAAGFRGDNPAGDAIGAALPKIGNGVKHMRALPHGEVSAALAKVRAADVWPCNRLALEFVVLTATRSGEVRGATWNEIDLDAAVWTVPGERMKAGREHRVPLSTRAIRSPPGSPTVRRRRPGRADLPIGTRAHPDGACTRQSGEATGDRSRPAWVPVFLPGLVRRDRAAARAGGSGPGAHNHESGRGGLCTVGSVRTAPPTDGRLGHVSGGLEGGAAWVNCPDVGTSMYRSPRKSARRLR